jgi:zinc protease
MLTPVATYGFPFDYVRQRELAVQQMTAADVKTLAQRLLRPEKMIYVIVGDKATQFGRLKELGLGDPVLVDRDGKAVAQ